MSAKVEWSDPIERAMSRHFRLIEEQPREYEFSSEEVAREFARGLKESGVYKVKLNGEEL